VPELSVRTYPLPDGDWLRQPSTDFAFAESLSIEPLCAPVWLLAGAFISGCCAGVEAGAWSLGNVDGVLGGLDDGEEDDGVDVCAAMNKEPLTVKAQRASFSFIDAS
jgi:hypothetical protein